MFGSLNIRPLLQIQEHLLMEELQAEVWCREEVVPMNQTYTAVKNGGIALGLFDEDILVGFCFGFAGFKDNKVYLCSHMLGLKEKYRYGGWGEKLKIAQMQEAIRLGYDLITWTFDPLESPNARLNIGKLRAIVRTYIPNCYGEMRSSINVGLPSDRFLAEWYITSPRVKLPQKLESIEQAQHGAQVVFNGEEPQLTYLDVNLTAEQLLFPIPIAFQDLRQTNPTIALDWRLKAREFFETYFKQGYAVTDCITGEKVHYYLLQKYR
jgi:predicted GNAT superfamily acetyltransferase